MKIITTLTCVLFGILIGMVFYIRYDQKKFIERLPDAPTVQPTEVSDTRMSPLDAAGEGELDSVEQATIIDDVEATNEVHDHVYDDASDVSAPQTIEFDPSEFFKTDEDFSEETSESLETKDTRTMAELAEDPYKHVEFLRTGLVKKYGDTPEVNAFLALELKTFIADYMTGEEVLRRSELLAKFYPHPDNIEALDATRKMVEHALDNKFYRELPGVPIEDLIIINPQ